MRRLHHSVVAAISQFFVFLLVFVLVAYCIMKSNNKPMFAHPIHIEGKQ